MDLLVRKPLLFFIFMASMFDIAQSGFNAAYLKKTNASYTCGSPPEEFYETQQGFLSAVDRVPFICNASDPLKAYPPENMVDGLLGTHWQSTAGEDLASITINFEQAFFVQSIDITFGNYRRPEAIMVEKSTDFGATFVPWHYLVTSPASRQCSARFGVQALQPSVIIGVGQVLCMEYKRYVPPEYNETIFIELNQKQRLDLQSWMNATTVRFRFSGLYRKFDSMATKWHHYTVREIAVTALCDCNGHADGNHCPLNQSTGLRACQCQGNTCGVQCDQCCTLYNQFPWKPGSVVPWTNDPAAKCEPCNCHNHSDTCTYNQTVSDLGLSMSINGSMIGGGVCVNCQHDTQGVNCERCKDYFYRPLGRNQSDADACHACNCNLNGTANAPGLAFGDCVRDQSVLSAHPGKQPGDCYCKANVKGRQCDACKAGYYRLTKEDPDGCIACNCHIEGTFNQSNVCQGDYRGQCHCKKNVDLRNCSQCKHGYYDLQDADINGCKSCYCDVGATRSGQKCDKITGVCHCYPHVVGRTCNRTQSGFYYPDAHYIHATRSPYIVSSVTYTLHVLLNISKTGNYRLLVHYNNKGNSIQGNAVIQNASGPLAKEDFTLRSTCEPCKERIKQKLWLNKGQWMINITTAGPHQQLQLDRVIAIPDEFIKGTTLGNQSAIYKFECNIEGSMSSGRCPSWFFSITMDYLQGALACDCHPLGSNSSICESYGGQCSCKPGVEGRDCGRCRPGFYNLTATGCTPCGCNAALNDICDVTTGMCECPENTVGRTCLPCQCNNNTNKCLRSGECLDCQFNTTGYFCQHCDNGTFGDARIQQCNACACNENGSLDQQCDRVSGQCSCKTKVTGRDCSECQSNTFDFGPAGCRECECNPLGSASLQCSSSGQCLCQANVTGLKCTQCTLGFYGLPLMSCRECNCSTTGAIPGTLCTSDTAGHCLCKPGVTGRSCDHCMKYFTNISDSGCAECSPCIQKLRHTIVNTTNDTNNTQVKIQALEDLTYFNTPLVETSGLLQQAKVEREQFYTRIATGSQVFQELVASNIPKTNESLTKLSVRARNLSSFSRDVAKNTTVILEDVKNEEQRTLSARRYVTSVDDLTRDVLAALNEYNTAASQYLTDSTNALQLARNRNFSQYSLNITEITRLTENSFVFVEETLKRVYSHLFLARDLKVSVEIRAANFSKIQEAWNQSQVQLINTIEQVYNHSQEIQLTLMETKNILDEELLALNRTRSLLSDTNVTLTDTRNSLMHGTSILEDLSQINSGNVVPSSGLTDLSNLLTTEIGKIKQKLRVAEIRLEQAQNQASFLGSLAQQMEQTLNNSHPHGSAVLLAIDKFSEIQELVNRSMGLVEQANSTVNNITKKLNVVSTTDLKHDAEMVWESLHELYNETLERNFTAYNLEKNIYDVNKTFLDSLTVWNAVYEKFPAIQNAAVRFQAAARKAPNVVLSLMNAQGEITNASILLTGLEMHLNQMDYVIDTLIEKTTSIRNTSSKGITMMNDAHVNVQNITTRLTPNPDEPPLNVTGRKATAVMDSLPPIRQQIEIHMDNTTKKLNQIRKMVASIPFALHLMNDSLVTFLPSRRTIESPFTNEISFDIKTNSSEGMLLYIVEEQHNLTARRFDELANSLGFYISNNLVHVVFDLGDGPITVQNPMELKNETWYNTYFTRFGAEAFLTVSVDPHNYETVMVNGSSVSGNNMLQLTNQSTIYLGGLPFNLTESPVSSHFNGIVDNLVIDNIRYNLWNPEQAYGNDRLYAIPRHKRMFYPPNGRAASFHGNGYIQHAQGEFNSSLGYTAVEVDFRTLHQNGIIMAVSNEQQRYIFVIFLQNGRVNFYFEPGQNDAITLKSTRSSYGDGRWYRVRVVRTSVNATLTVNLVGSRETPDSRFVDTGVTVMGSSHVITFGALNPNSITSFVVTDAFSGDMNNLLLFTGKRASLISRTFNDAALVIAKGGVSFYGVIRGQIEYGTRFYGYRKEVGECSYARIDVGSEIGATTSLTFTFKTKESGVLLYSGNHGNPSLYLTLLHGDLLLWLGDIKSSPVFSSSNTTFSDNSWHILHLASSENRYSLHVNDTLLYSFVASSLILQKPFYMGGVPRNMSLHVPYALCFKGGMKNLVINSGSVSFFSGHTIGVSRAGVIPARVPPPVPKTCSASFDPPTSFSNARRVHFGLLGSKKQGYIGLNLTDQRSATFSSNFAVGLVFRALTDDGLLIYATDNDTHPTQFFSLELVRGRLVYKFDSGRGLVSISTNDKYSGKGHCYRVHIIRWLHFGAILVSTREYTNGKHDPPSNTMNLRQLYIGGVPSHVVAPYLTNRYLGFVGCISDFEVEPNRLLFDLTKVDMIGPDKSIGSCYSVAQPGLGFGGSAWARFDNFTLNENFNIQLTFRTSSRDGLLFVISGNSTTEAGNRMYVRLEQSSGQIILIYNTTVNESRVVWTEPGLGNNSKSSYLMCQMKWHTVRVTKLGLNITLTVDEAYHFSGPVTHGASMSGQLFLGGYPANRPGGNDTVRAAGFKGCLKSFSLDGHSLHFAGAAELSQVVSACPLSNKEREPAVNIERCEN